MCSAADDFGKIAAADRMVIDGIEDAGKAFLCGMEQRSGRVVTVGEVHECPVGTERQGFTFQGGFQKAAAPRAVNPAEPHGCSADVGRNPLGFQQNIAGRGASDGGTFIDERTVILRVNRCASGENDMTRLKHLQKVTQCLDVGDAVGRRVASTVSAQAVDEDVMAPAAGQRLAEPAKVGGVRGDDMEGFAAETPGGFGG